MLVSFFCIKRKISRRSLFGGEFVARQGRDGRNDGYGGGDDEFPLSYDAKLDGVAYGADTSPAGERFNTFNEFAIKIVMQSNDARIVPVVKDLRAIAVE